MPSVLIKTNVVGVPDEKQYLLMKQVSGAVSELTGKPESFVLVSYETCKMIFGGTLDPCAYVYLASLGALGADVNPTIVKALSGFLANVGIPANRIYVQFCDVTDRNDFGWNGTTFG